MKTLFKSTLCSLLSVGMLAACSNEPLPDLTGSSTINRDGAMINIPDTTTAITTARALDIAARFARATPSRSSSAAESIEVATGENGEPLLYAVNYSDNNGFVVISASRHYFPILAQSETGNFHLSDITDEHSASVWLAEKKFTVRHATSLPDSIKEKIASQWVAYDPQVPYTETASSSRSDVPDKPQVFYDSLKRWSMDPNVTVYRYEDYILTQEYQSLSQYEKERIEVGIHTYGNSNYGTPESSTLVIIHPVNTIVERQLIHTQWGQSYPYNKACDNIFEPLGCTTIAAGQIMKYHKHPSSYNWDLMPNNTASDETARFLRDLKGKIYGTSKEVNIYNVMEALNNMGYSATIEEHTSSHNYQEVYKNGYPVYQRGEYPGADAAHAWVCSGHKSTVTRTMLRFMTLEYRPTSYSTPDKMVEAYSKEIGIYTSEYFYFNWGWDGNQDGYFDDSSFTVKLNNETTHFRSKRMDLIIHPNK